MRRCIHLVIPFLSLVSFCQVKQVQLKDFELQSSAIAGDDGAAISGGGYQPANYWFHVKVPCTVLTGLVANKIYPDPYLGMNNMLIPDASDSFNKQYHLEQYSYLPNEPNPWKKPYWYRSKFRVPAADKGKFFQLIFKGINYRADVWLNGTRVADSSQMAGMFAEYSLDVTSLIHAGEMNFLAVKIYPLDFPGLPAHPQLNALGDFYSNGGANGDIGKNITMLCSAGWDWIPEVHDRNIGIWQPVYLRTSGDVVISQPHIITVLPGLPDTSVANISITLSLVNHSNQSKSGKLRLTISAENFAGAPVIIDQNVSIEAKASNELNLGPENVKQFAIRNPHLWWPNNYGNPSLYRMRIQFLNNNTEVSDDTSFVFGIRTVGSKTASVNGWLRRDFYVNGKRVHLVGGAWVPDMMLNRDSLRNDYELHLCRNANVNLVRIWGGGLAETDDFYELADRYGLMVWQDFWVTGDTHGEFNGSRDYPPRGDIYVHNIISTIFRIRNHPSLLVWTGGNEGHARKELYDAMRDNVASLDGTRPFIPSSSGFAKLLPGWKGSWPDDQTSGVYSGGPYSWQDAAQYYSLADNGKDWVFKDETGIPSQPPFASLAKIITDLVPDSSLPYPLNNSWGYHDACTGNGHYETYYNAMKQRYGAPTSMKDYCDKMQLVNADGYRAIFEAADHKLNETGGVMLWKLNAAFPSVMWQVYDWFLEPNAGYYFMKRACEPLHIQFNLDDSAVAVVNRAYRKFRGLTVTADIFDINGQPVYHHTATADIDTTTSEEIFGLASPISALQAVSFVSLHLTDSHGNVISSNLYWIQPKHDYNLLAKMKPARLEVKIMNAAKKNIDAAWQMRITNSSQLAFFINPQLLLNGEEIAPCFWSDNYFSLQPNETKTVTVSCPLSQLKNLQPSLRISGWNLPPSEISLPLK